MNAAEAKRALRVALIEVENVMLHDLSTVSVSDTWSNLSDAQEHLEFIRNHLQNLLDAIVDRK